MAVKAGIVRHLKVMHDVNGYMLGTSKAFGSLPALIENFRRESLATHFPDIQTALLLPCGTIRKCAEIRRGTQNVVVDFFFLK